jgi:PAS domain S-box-containing protein
MTSDKPEPPIRNEDRRAEAAGWQRDRLPELAALASVLPVGILRTDLEGRCFYVSERVTDLTGLTAESAMQSGWEQCVHPDDRETVLGQVSSALRATKPGQAEFRCVLQDGRIRWLLSQATPEHDPQGRVVGFVWTFTDTTHTHEALRASEERFRLATKSAGVGVLDYDVMADQGIWSPEVCLLLGVPEGRLTTLAEAVDFCHPDDRARVEGAMAAALDPRGSGAFAEEFRIRRADTGEVRWVASACQTFFDGAADDRRPVRFTGITTDVTERRARETHVQFLSEHLQRNEERQALLLRLSDALRPLSNPLDVQEVSSKLLGEHLGVNRVGYAELENREYIIRREYARGVAPLAGQAQRGFAAALRDAFRRGDTVVVSDVDTDPRFTEPERVAMRARQIAAFVGVMLLKGGQLVAAFGANSATPRSWAPIEIALIRDVAERTWEAVERARAEAALRQRELRLRLALDASAGGSWTWEASSNQLDWDDDFRTRYGFTPEEPPTRDAWLSRVHEEDRPQVLGLLGEILGATGKDAWDNTFRIVLPDGNVSWIQSLGRADRAADGHVTRLTGLDLDITARRRAEEALQARRDEERDRELQLLLETATQGIVSVDAQATIVTANRALEAMFGWAPGELIGQSIERLVPPSVRDAHVQHWTGYFAAPGPRPMGVNRELFGQRKDGSTFPLEVSLNHVATAGGGHAIAFVTDITERKRAEAALQERTVELEHRTAQLSRLASDLTLAEQRAREQLAKTLHDGLQQLLVSAALNLERHVTLEAQQGAQPDELLVRAKSHLDEASAAARSLSLDLFPPALHGSGFPAALTWLAERTRHQYGLVVHVSADPLANSDRKDVRTLLFESVRELLFNAVKHAQVDRVTIDLSLDHNDALCITVTDQGIGFDPAGLVERGKAGEAGWGLFSIRERLTLLGGRFDIESAPGQGTRFRLVAPRGEAQGGIDAQRRPSRVATGPALHGAAGFASARALRILLVDDHAAIRRVLRELFQERPELHVVGEAADGFEAIAEAHALRPDVILMDVSMPGMDGVEATRRISAELPFIQILGLSTHVKTEELHSIERAGAAGFFTKGVDSQRLIDHLMAVHAAITLELPSQQA